MSNVFVQLDISMIIPTIQVYREYFNSKYSCTDDSNDGSNMTIEDELKCAIYNYLLSLYNKSPEIYKIEYENKISEIKKQLSR